MCAAEHPHNQRNVLLTSVCGKLSAESQRGCMNSGCHVTKRWSKIDECLPVEKDSASRRSLGSCAALMEDILRWGTQDLFQARKDSDDKQAAEPSGQPEPPFANGDAAQRDGSGNLEAPKQSKVKILDCCLPKMFRLQRQTAFDCILNSRHSVLLPKSPNVHSTAPFPVLASKLLLFSAALIVHIYAGYIL